MLAALCGPQRGLLSTSYSHFYSHRETRAPSPPAPPAAGRGEQDLRHGVGGDHARSGGPPAGGDVGRYLPAPPVGGLSEFAAALSDAEVGTVEKFLRRGASR